MVFTGAFSMPKEDIMTMAKIKGAKVTGAVSSATTYLVCGEILEDGRAVTDGSKHRKMVELKEKGKKHPEPLTEEEFLKMAEKAIMPDDITMTPEPLSSTQQASPSKMTLTPTDPSPSMPSRTTSTMATPVPLVASGTDGTPWVNKYAPRTVDDLVGNQTIVAKLRTWLEDWDDVVLNGNKKKQTSFRGNAENVNARAVLLSGPPGIGKSTTARLIAKTVTKYNVQEYNASDARSKKIIDNMARGIADNCTLEFGRKGQLTAAPRNNMGRPLIIMDEVDGMGAGDRGGSQALIKMIKQSRNPIICICNDRQDSKIRTLSSHCYDLKFARPTKDAIAKRAAQICRAEGLTTDMNALEELVVASGNDIRNVVTQLQFLSHQSRDISYGKVKGEIARISKDLQVNAMDACRKLLSTQDVKKLNLNQRMELFFADYDLMPLLIQENYVRSCADSKDPMIMQKIAHASDSILIGDTLSNRLRSTNNWGLLPDVGFMSSVYPSLMCNGFIGFPTFPAYLGKNSSANKAQRLVKELHNSMWPVSSVTSKNMMTSGYVDLLFAKAMKPLKSGEKERVHETAEVLDAYRLTKDHLAEHLSDLRKPFYEYDEFKLVDSAIKTALTKEFNSGKYLARTTLVKKRPREAGMGGLGAEDGDADVVAAESDSEDEKGEDIDALLKAAKGKSSKKVGTLPFAKKAKK
eukprot:GEMP01010610.1.p1 GENE.GEMP01010610.1~~GEMP01010610.1.p1  ORF type:complete len:692 (-),score=165.55 GEMP01010610.1:629-2704(-)